MQQGNKLSSSVAGASLCPAPAWGCGSYEKGNTYRIKLVHREVRLNWAEVRGSRGEKENSPLLPCPPAPLPLFLQEAWL